MEPIEIPIEYWTPGRSGDVSRDSFWTKEAMQSAISQMWYPLRHEKSDALPDRVILSIDRERGVVILEEA